MSNERLQGVISYFNQSRGFGFIKCPAYGEDIYFHFTFIEGGEDSQLYSLLYGGNEQKTSNSVVSFIIRKNQGNLQAINIRFFEQDTNISLLLPLFDYFKTSLKKGENFASDFWGLVNFSLIPLIEENTELRKSVIVQITQSISIWEKIVELSQLFQSLTKISGGDVSRKDTEEVLDIFFTYLTSIFGLKILSDAEFISSFSAYKINAAIPSSPVRWFRQALDLSLLVFPNFRALQQAMQRDDSLVISTNRSIKIIMLQNEDEFNYSEIELFAESRLAIVRQRELLRSIGEQRDESSGVLGQLLQTFLPIHLLQPYEVGSDYNNVIFTGRAKLRSQILDDISSNWAIYGGRKIGKSWFLKDICFHCQDKIFSDLYTPIYISVQGLESVDEVIDQISTYLQLNSKIPISQANSPSKRLIYYLNKVNRETERIILLAIDEVDELLCMDGCSEFLGVLRGYWQNHPQSLKIIFAGFKELMGKFYEESTNFPLANWIGKNHISLSCLDPDEMQKLIIEPLNWLGFDFNKALIISAIYELTSGHPYYTQSLCQTVVKHCLTTKTKRINEKLVRQLATESFRFEIFDIFESNLSIIQKLIGKTCISEDHVFSLQEIHDLLFQRFDIEINLRQLQDELRVLVACSVFTRSYDGYRVLLPNLNQDYFATKDDTVLALAYLEGKNETSD